MKEIEKLEGMALEDLEYTLVMDGRSAIMIVDDEDVVRTVFEHLLESSGHRLYFAASAGEAMGQFARDEFDLLVVDKNLPDMSGLELARQVRERKPLVDFMVITGYASYDSAIEALRLGALDYIEKPFDDIDVLKHKIERAIEFQRLHAENVLLADQLRQAHRKLNEALHRQGDALGGIPAGSAHALFSTPVAADLIRQAHARLSRIAAGKSVQRRDLVQLKNMLAGAWQELTGSIPQA